MMSALCQDVCQQPQQVLHLVAVGLHVCGTGATGTAWAAGQCEGSARAARAVVGRRFSDLCLFFFGCQDEPQPGGGNPPLATACSGLYPIPPTPAHPVSTGPAAANPRRSSHIDTRDRCCDTDGRGGAGRGSPQFMSVATELPVMVRRKSGSAKASATSSIASWPTV